MPSKEKNEINFQTSMAAMFKVWEWIRNFILHLMLDVIIYPHWDLS